jgi:hypothetical protein
MKKPAMLPEKSDLEHKFTHRVIPAFLFLCLVFSVFLFVFRNIPHGHRYDLVLKLTVEIFLVWLVYSSEPRWLGRTAVLILVLMAGLALGVYQLKTINSDPEIIETYKSVFQDLKEGRNPYTSGRIYHRDENDQVVYQNFNYPPLELYPYWFFYRLVKTWNVKTLTALLVMIQLLAGVILLLTFKKVKKIYLLAFLPLLTFSEIHTNPAMTMLSVAIFLFLIYRQANQPSDFKRFLTAAFIGLGSLTKFFFLPLAAVYYLSRLDLRDRTRMFKTFQEILVSALVALVFMLPFGPWNIIKSTIIFNLNVGERNQVTTFYPNILSAVFYLIKKPGLYPWAAVLIFLLSLVLASRLKPLTGMLFIGLVFLFVSPTPEPQYFGTMLLLVLGAKLWEMENQLANRGFFAKNIRTENIYSSVSGHPGF